MLNKISSKTLTFTTFDGESIYKCLKVYNMLSSRLTLKICDTMKKQNFMSKCITIPVGFADVTIPPTKLCKLYLIFNTFKFPRKVLPFGIKKFILVNKLI